jgi:hypothetical protein
MVNELQARLRSLYAARAQRLDRLAQVGPQVARHESYRITASGEQLYTLLEAADRIAELEAALLKYGHHIPECDYLQGHLPCTCGFEALRSGLNREGEHE